MSQRELLGLGDGAGGLLDLAADRGIVLHTGPRSFQHEPDIWYLPIAAFWPE